MTDSTAADSDVARLVEEVLPDITELRRALHRRPELMFEEHETSSRVVAELQARSIEHIAGLARGTGVLAHLPGGDGEPIGLRADMDALPIEEATGKSWTSQHPGRMHACGHDGHTAILVGTARVLSEIAARRGLPRPVTLLFQPGEEGGGGGRLMVEEGALDGSRLGPPLERIYGLHGWPTLRLGHVATRPGPMLAASDAFEIVVGGTGGHAALPHLLHNPVEAAAAMVSALAALPAVAASATDSAVVSTTAIHGGHAFNVIPETVRLKGTVRTLRRETRELLHEAIRRTCEGAAAARGCRVEVRIDAGFPVTVNDPICCNRFDTVMERTFGSDRLESFPEPTMGSEDFSYYGERIPACFYALGLQAEGESPVPPLHSPYFDFDDRALATGIRAMVALALEG